MMENDERVSILREYLIENKDKVTADLKEMRENSSDVKSEYIDIVNDNFWDLI